MIYFPCISGKCSILSSGNILTLRFDTNAFDSFPGFLAKYYARDKADLIVNSTFIDQQDLSQGESLIILDFMFSNCTRIISDVVSPIKVPMATFFAAPASWVGSCDQFHPIREPVSRVRNQSSHFPPRTHASDPLLFEKVGGGCSLRFVSPYTPCYQGYLRMTY